MKRGGWENIIDWLDRASRQHHVVALRDGMISVVPVILVGSTFLLLGAQERILSSYFPGLYQTGFGTWYHKTAPLLLVPYRVTMGALSLYAAFTVAVALARRYGLPPVPQGLGAVAAFLVTGVPRKCAVLGGEQWVLPLLPIGAQGLFLAIVVAVATVEISRILLRRRAMDKPGQPKQPAQGGVPPAVVAAFSGFAPILLVVFIAWCIRHLWGLDLQALILTAVEPLRRLGDTVGAVIGVNILLHLFGVAGVHGISVINAVMLPIWQQFVAVNAEAHTTGKELVYVTAYPFYQWFVWIGGAGSTLAPTMLLLRSSSEHMRKVGKMALIPAFFNVNEPFLFGLPVVANPTLAIPFILAPVLNGITAYWAVASGWVGKPFIEVPWVMPCFLGAPLATQDLRGLGLMLVNLVISAVVWYPFLKMYERVFQEADSGERYGGGEDADSGRDVSTLDRVDWNNVRSNWWGVWEITGS